MAFDSIDNDYVLGKTGQTVVYVFPTGHALMDRNKKAAQIQLDSVLKKVLPPIAPPAHTAVPETADYWIQRLVDQGKLTEAQALVIRYDLETTGIDWQDALKMRGWFTLDMESAE